VKVISGFLKGRTIKGHNIDGTRPTMDRVKESLFAMIQNDIIDSIVLDLFSGSGNLGIESISNGSKLCYFNDINKECIKSINDNINLFDIKDKSIIINKTWSDCLKYLSNLNVKLDIIFLDPPYKMDCLNEVIDKIINYNLLNHNGLIVCEVSNDYLKDFDILDKIKMRKYGDKFIIIYRNK
jgi:16S rRNA (guanine(966)-N(2))-methyltransferase RsmD